MYMNNLITHTHESESHREYNVKVLTVISVSNQQQQQKMVLIVNAISLKKLLDNMKFLLLRYGGEGRDRLTIIRSKK